MGCPQVRAGRLEDSLEVERARRAELTALAERHKLAVAGPPHRRPAPLSTSSGSSSGGGGDSVGRSSPQPNPVRSLSPPPRAIDWLGPASPLNQQGHSIPQQQSPPRPGSGAVRDTILNSAWSTAHV